MCNSDEDRLWVSEYFTAHPGCPDKGPLNGLLLLFLLLDALPFLLSDDAKPLKGRSPACKCTCSSYLERFSCGTGGWGAWWGNWLIQVHLKLTPVPTGTSGNEVLPSVPWSLAIVFRPLCVTLKPCRSSVNVVRQVFCGLPFGLLLSHGIQFMATFAGLSEHMMTSRCHPLCFAFTISDRSLIPDLVSSSLLTRSLRDIAGIVCIHCRWKTSKVLQVETGPIGSEFVAVCSNWFQRGDGTVQEPQVPGLGPRRSDEHQAVLALLLLQHRRHHLRRRQYGPRPHRHIKAGTGLHAWGVCVKNHFLFWHYHPNTALTLPSVLWHC